MSSMQRYFEQLVEDIRESAKNKDQNVQYHIPEDLLNIPEEYEYLPVELQQKAYEWFRLSPEMFPPASKWSPRQLLYMCVVLRQLFEHYNIMVEMPNDLPYKKVYQYLLKALNMDTSCHQEYINQISFCEGERSSCPFGDYCAFDGKYHCDTWSFGGDWEGYSDLKAMDDDDED